MKKNNSAGRAESPVALISLLGERLPSVHVLQATPLHGGLSNRCYRIQAEHAGQPLHLVWRPNSPASEAFGVSRQHEAAILSQLESTSPLLAPALFAALPEGILVEWVEGEMADDQLDTASLLSLQVAVHRLPPPSWRLDCRERGVHYWQALASELKDATLHRIHHRFQAASPLQWFGDTCCHHDLGCYNIIVGDPLRVIDWEYASAGDPSLDLTMTIAANGLDPHNAVLQYCQAAGIVAPTEIKRWHQAVAYWQPWCEYLALLWYLLGWQHWQEPTYLEQAEILKQRLA